MDHRVGGLAGGQVLARHKQTFPRGHPAHGHAGGNTIRERRDLPRAVAADRKTHGGDTFCVHLGPRREKFRGAQVFVRYQPGKRRAELKKVRRQRLLIFVTAAAAVRPIQHVGGEAGVAAPGQFIPDETAAIVLSDPLASGFDFLGRFFPRFDDLFLADVELRAVIVQQ